MIPIKDLIDWLTFLEQVNPGNSIAIDDGGLTLVELDGAGRETTHYMEVGGIPKGE